MSDIDWFTFEIHLRSDDANWSIGGFFRGQHGPQTNCGLLGSDGIVVFKL
jgi:hypothetical protein